MKKTLRLILGDQLNMQHSWYNEKKTNKIYILMELRQETDYVTHHIQKVVGFFQAMRNFHQWLVKEGFEAHYIKINDQDNSGSLKKNLNTLISKHSIEHFEYQLPDEYRLDQELSQFCQDIDISSKVYDTEHFYTSREALGNFFKGKKQFLMETFYRMMRKKHNVLMRDNDPVGDQWNFDKQNRNKYKGEVPIPKPYSISHDVSDLVEEIASSGCKTMGKIDPTNFRLPTNREESIGILEHFITKLLPHFGTYQDALYTEDYYLFHSQLSFALNTKMISPGEVVNKTENSWQQRKDEVSLAQVEGFIRQILGWREFMRGIYWAKMPGYKTENYFRHTRKLPDFFWTGNTKMKCLEHSIKQSLDTGYAHHIQRLMVTGNFALLNLTDPDEVDAWYLGIYNDAIEWVEITNTRGMSQFADGGIVGTKPYISSANYIQKMSNYCQQCSYSAKKKTGKDACPFNSLYWNFYDQHRDVLGKNQRVAMMYRTWDKKSPKEREELLQQADYYLQNIDTL